LILVKAFGMALPSPSTVPFSGMVTSAQPGPMTPFLTNGSDPMRRLLRGREPPRALLPWIRPEIAGTNQRQRQLKATPINGNANQMQRHEKARTL
jgi:hypothetical protein